MNTGQRAELSEQGELELAEDFEARIRKARLLYNTGAFEELSEEVNFLFESAFCETQNFFISRNFDGSLTDRTNIDGMKFYEVLNTSSVFYMKVKIREMLDLLDPQKESSLSFYSAYAKMNHYKFLEIFVKYIVSQPTFIVLLEEHEILNPKNPILPLDDVARSVLKYMDSDFTKPNNANVDDEGYDRRGPSNN